MITNKHAPESTSDLIGNPKSHEELEHIILSGGRVIISGTPGIGKTSAVYAIAKQHNLTIIESNGSDARTASSMSKILQQCQLRDLANRPLVYLIDEIDGAHFNAWKTLEKIIVFSRYPVVLTANDDWKIDESIKKLCTHIKLRKPQMKSVLSVAKNIASQEGITKTSNYENIKQNDIRNAINIVIYGGESYDTSTIFTSTHQLFTEQDPTNISLKTDIAWLIDNAPNYLTGANLLHFYEILEIASRTRPTILHNIPKGRGDYPKFPMYYRLRRKKNEHT